MPTGGWPRSNNHDPRHPTDPRRPEPRIRWRVPVRFVPASRSQGMIGSADPSPNRQAGIRLRRPVCRRSRIPAGIRWPPLSHPALIFCLTVKAITGLVQAHFIFPEFRWSRSHQHADGSSFLQQRALGHPEFFQRLGPVALRPHRGRATCTNRLTRGELRSRRACRF